VNAFETGRILDRETVVAFIPSGTGCVESARNDNVWCGLPLVDRILKEVGRPMQELIRRTRRLGPLDGGAVVLLTGCRPGAGCTTVAMAFASAAARENSVLLIDGDLSQRGLSAHLGLPVRFGWDDALADLCSLDEALHAAGAPLRCPVLPLRQAAGDLSGSLNPRVLAEWHAQVRRDFELVVIDGGPVWDSGAGWAPWADVAVLVCDSGQKLAEDWAAGWDRLEEGGACVLGIVETLS
jgi:Mrp family chromosome partitioning ATPase